MNVKFKLLNKELPEPSRGTPHSAGIDLRLSTIKRYENGVYTLGTGVAVQIPYGHFGMLAVRSSTGAKGLQLTNSVGIIDADYRGEILLKCTFQHRGVDFPATGTRIAQLIIVPYVIGDIKVVEDLNNTHRGEDGYGSTDG